MQAFTRAIKRLVKFPSVTRTVKDRTWILEFSATGLRAWPRGEAQRTRSLTWLEIISFLVVYGRGNGRG